MNLSGHSIFTAVFRRAGWACFMLLSGETCLWAGIKMFPSHVNLSVTLISWLLWCNQNHQGIALTNHSSAAYRFPHTDSGREAITGTPGSVPRWVSKWSWESNDKLSEPGKLWTINLSTIPDNQEKAERTQHKISMRSSSNLLLLKEDVHLFFKLGTCKVLVSIALYYLFLTTHTKYFPYPKIHLDQTYKKLSWNFFLVNYRLWLSMTKSGEIILSPHEVAFCLLHASMWGGVGCVYRRQLPYCHEY